jgi:hypothetical protein
MADQHVPSSFAESFADLEYRPHRRDFKEEFDDGCGQSASSPANQKMTEFGRLLEA